MGTKELGNKEEKTSKNALAKYAKERILADENQRALLNILEDFLDEKTKVEEINDKLAVSNQELEAFTYSVSHDLRAPLRAIGGFAQIINKEYAAVLDEEGKLFLSIIIENVTNMGTLIDDLLSFSRIGREKVVKREVDLETLVKEVIVDLENVVSHKAKFIINELGIVKADYGLLRQVVFNLVSNAVKYSSKTENPIIKISTDQLDESVIFSVKDNGAGFDMKYYDKLFGVFQRLHLQSDFEGVGVGLAIVERVISKHEGEVWAHGKVGEGATFYFSLPNSRSWNEK